MRATKQQNNQEKNQKLNGNKENMQVFDRANIGKITKKSVYDERLITLPC